MVIAVPVLGWEEMVARAQSVELGQGSISPNGRTPTTKLKMEDSRFLGSVLMVAETSKLSPRGKAKLRRERSRRLPGGKRKAALAVFESMTAHMGCLGSVKSGTHSNVSNLRANSLWGSSDAV